MSSYGYTKKCMIFTPEAILKTATFPHMKYKIFVIATVKLKKAKFETRIENDLHCFKVTMQVGGGWGRD